MGRVGSIINSLGLPILQKSSGRLPSPICGLLMHQSYRLSPFSVPSLWGGHIFNVRYTESNCQEYCIHNDKSCIHILALIFLVTGSWRHYLKFSSFHLFICKIGIRTSSQTCEDYVSVLKTVLSIIQNTEGTAGHFLQ